MAYKFGFGDTAASMLDRALERQGTESRFSREMDARSSQFQADLEDRRAGRKESSDLSREQMGLTRDQITQSGTQFKENQEADFGRAFQNQYGLLSALSPEMRKIAGPGATGAELAKRGGFTGNLSTARISPDERYVDLRLLGLGLQQSEMDAQARDRARKNVLPMYNKVTGEITGWDWTSGSPPPGYTDAQKRRLFEEEAPPQIPLNTAAKAGEWAVKNIPDWMGWGHIARGALSPFSNVDESNARATERASYWSRGYKNRRQGPLQDWNMLDRAMQSDSAPADRLIQWGLY